MTSNTAIVCGIATFSFMFFASSSPLPSQDNIAKTVRGDGNVASPDADQSYNRFKGEDAGQKRTDNGIKMCFVWCPPGAFVMGDFNDDDVKFDQQGKPKPDVTQPVKAFLTRGLWMGSHEVRQDQWRQFMGTEPWKGKNRVQEGDSFPATYVSFHDATAFCNKLTEQERGAKRIPREWKYTLPTEAQWERACRAGTETRYHFGKDETLLNDYAWNMHNAIDVGESYPHPTGQKRPNPWGLYDMHGNVWEWCRDVHDYKLSGGKDPEYRPEVPLSATSHRTLRGGCFHEQEPRCRSGMRQPGEPDYRGPQLGFRVALIFSLAGEDQ